MKKKVIIGLSGGVDSSVAAALLIEQGYEVEGVFMRNWDSAANQDFRGNPTLNDEVCEQEKDYLDAKKVAETLGIVLHRVDFIEDYWDRVFSYFLDEYKKNRTPNPDVLCNNEIKFKAFIDYAKKLDYDYIAMGHYARVDLSQEEPILLRAIDESKDQSYFLSQLKSEQLNNVIFPVGHLYKKQVREIAIQKKLVTAKKKDSTGICFIGERHFSDFLSNYLPAQPGLMKRLDGTVIKSHHGLMNYTIGQRKGLGIGGTQESVHAWYVVGKDLKTNTLYVEPDDNHPHLYSDQAIIQDVVWRGKKFEGDCFVKFRYRQKDVPCTIKWLDENTIEVLYDRSVKAVTPGQVAAFYQAEVCLGAGFIDKVYFDKKLRQYT
jgi:tRNA-uridine 2-sulfurtransferase